MSVRDKVTVPDHLPPIPEGAVGIATLSPDHAWIIIHLRHGQGTRTVRIRRKDLRMLTGGHYDTVPVLK
ncbi:hypothetical protein DRO48_00845 [Candidatus Bathyarchaeota archaeon]|nr:MAG: hypothetical protein DRO48_00845 [Candidatus Bathyarchaeota archaeon]